MDNVTIRHSWGNGLRVEQTTLSVSDSAFTDNGWNGIQAVLTNLQLTGIYTARNGGDGVRANNSSLVIRNSTLLNYLYNYGLENIGPTSPAQARDNWWGDPSGPYHPTLNPQGHGSPVSDGVVFDPWQAVNDRALRQPQDIAVGQVVTTSLGLMQLADYRLPVSAGQGLVLDVIPTTPGAALWVFAQSNALPTFSAYLATVQAPNPAGAYELPLIVPQDGELYLTVYSHAAPSSGAGFRLQVVASPRLLSGASPTSGGNAGLITLDVSGMPFATGMDISLRPSGLADPSAATHAFTVTEVTSTTLWARLDLRGLAPGLYDLAAAWPGSVGESVLPRAFTVTAGSGPRLEVSISLPAQVRSGRKYTLWLNYANRGDADLDAPFIILSSPTHAPLGLDPTELVDRSLALSG